MFPLVSVIIPVYNAEKYLGRCLESVLAQDYPNLEIVLIDDGSTDACPGICDTYQRTNRHIYVEHIPNGGASMARKKGLESAQGEYVCFVDSDDYVSTNYVLELYRIIQKYGIRISACNVLRIHENEKRSSKTCMYVDELLPFEKLMPRFFKYEFWGFPGMLYHYSVFKNLIFPKATLSEDYYVKAQLFCQERKMAVTSASLYFYEYHPSSLSHTKLSARAFEEFENVKAVYDLALQHCPEYADYALSNVVETIVKLSTMTAKDNQGKFQLQYAPLKLFLHNHKEEIAACEILNKHVRLLAKGFVDWPRLTRLISRWLING